MIISTIINNLVLNIVTKKIYPKIICKGTIDKNEKKIIKKNVTALMCHKVGATVLNSSDNIVISSILGLEILTKYSNYYYLMNAFSTIIIICFSGLTGGIGNSFALEAKKKNTDYFKKTLFFNGYLTIVFGTILFTIYRDFITIWLGKSYIFNNIVSVLFIIYFYIHTIRRTIIVFRDAAGMWWANKLQPIISACLNLFLNIILVNIIGIYGILISTIIAMIIIDIPMEARAFCGKKIDLKFEKYIYYILRYFTILVFSCVICYFITFKINVNLLFKLVIDIMVALVISNLLIYISYCKKNEYKFFKSTIKTFFIKNKG